MLYERPYQKLIVWKESHQLCLKIYEITKSFPSIEQFRLIDQMCRASSSIPANIAEGSGKTSKKERFRYYETASCSLEELHYHSLLSRDLRYTNEQTFNEIDNHIHRISYLLGKLKSSLF